MNVLVENCMSILTGAAIKDAVVKGDVVIEPYDSARVGPNSYDVSLSRNLMQYRLTTTFPSSEIGRVSMLDCYEQNECDSVPLLKRDDGREGWILLPGILYLGVTEEKTAGNKYVPHIDGRSSIGRLGIRIHATAGRGDVGFSGRWTLEIDVVHPIWVEPGIRIGQISWTTLEGPIDDLYHTKQERGKYQDSEGVVPSRLFLEKK